MKNSLLKIMILSLVFISMPACAMLRPCMKALMQYRDGVQEFFLKQVFDATQKESSKIKNVFFVTHQFNDHVLSRRLQELHQCGIPVHVLISHDAAYQPSSSSWLLDELHASGVCVKVFDQKYDDKIINLTFEDIWKDCSYAVRQIHLLDQPNNMSLLVVQQDDKSNNTLVLQSGNEVSLTSGHRQFNIMHKKISTIFHDKDKSEQFQP
ncbi:MAG: hypothetical protein WC747_04890 [Candidatus Babeliales bacterium]|jgi:hypothetical protein